MNIRRKLIFLLNAVLSALVLSACAEAPKKNSPLTPTGSLAGSSWQLVKFQGGDDRTITPDDKTKYTVTFNTDGSMAMRVDCNRGSGTWKSTGPSQLELDLRVLTRAMCPPESMHDQIVKQWPFIRSYIIKERRLFLSLMADGGNYEFEAISTP